MKVKYSYIIVLCLMITYLGQLSLFAQERLLYVGDIIELEISNETYSLEDIQEAFKDFEIIDVQEEKENYIIKLRSFEAKEYQVKLNNQDITIIIHSLLDEKDTKIVNKEVIVEDELGIRDAGLSLPWTIIKYISLGIFILGLILTTIYLLKHRKKKPLKPYEEALRKIQELPLSHEQYINQMTIVFKDYVSQLVDKSLQTMTTSELILYLNQTSQLEGFESIKELTLWLNRCDLLKYSREKSDQDSKLELFETCKNLINQIHQYGEVTS